GGERLLLEGGMEVAPLDDLEQHGVARRGEQAPAFLEKYIAHRRTVDGADGAQPAQLGGAEQVRSVAQPQRVPYDPLDLSSSKLRRTLAAGHRRARIGRPQLDHPGEVAAEVVAR